MFGFATKRGRGDWRFFAESAINISLRQPEDAIELNRLIRLASNAKQRDRLRAVALAIAGHPTLEIAAMLGRSRSLLQHWCYTYRDHGLDAVAPKRQPGRPPKLDPKRHAAFKQRVLDGALPGDGVCTLRGRDFQRILQEEFGVSYQLQGVYDLLHRPRNVNHSVRVSCPHFRGHRKSDPEAQAAWLEHAPLLSATSSGNTPAKESPCGSKMKYASANKAR